MQNAVVEILRSENCIRGRKMAQCSDLNLRKAILLNVIARHFFRHLTTMGTDSLELIKLFFFVKKIKK